MDNIEALKRMFEEDVAKKADANMEREKRFIADATKTYLGNRTVSTIQGYEPKEMIAFLESPIDDVQNRMGGEWKEMDKSDFETFVYTVTKKIKKSTMLLDWSK